MIEQITDYEGNAKDLVISQFKESENLNSLIGIFSDEMQVCEAKIFDLLNKRMLDEGEGVQLDRIGEIVGEARNGRSDEDYAGAISTRAVINASGGEAEAIITACVLLLDASKVHLRRLYPANLQVWTLTGTALDLSEEVQLLAKITASGFGFYLFNNTDTPFVLSDLTGGEDTDGDGLSDTGATSTGGELAEVYHGS